MGLKLKAQLRRVVPEPMLPCGQKLLLRCVVKVPVLPWVPIVQLRCVFPVTTVNFHGSQKPS